MLSSINHDWDDDHAVKILGTCQAAMADTACVLLVEMLVMSSGGRQRTEAEFRMLLRRIELRLTRIVPSTGRISLVDAVPESLN